MRKIIRIVIIVLLAVLIVMGGFQWKNYHKKSQFRENALLYFKGEVYGYKYHSQYFNLGEKTGFIKASLHYAMKDKKNKEELLNFIKDNI